MRFRYWPDITVPPAALKLGLVPNEYGNDASPRMSLEEEMDTDDGDEYGISLWCGDEETAQETGSIWLVTLGHNVVLYDGDELGHALATVKAYIAARTMPALKNRSRR